MAKRRQPNVRTWPAHWDLTGSLARAQAALTAAGGPPDLLRAVQAIKDPVAKARKIAELFAATDMLMSVALSQGTAPADLEAHRAGYRLMADMLQRRLSIVGLKSGEVLEADVSERMQDFLARFFDRKRGKAEVEDDDAR